VTGSAELGFIIFSQYKQSDGKVKSSYWLVPQDLYDSIERGAILLKKGINKVAAQDFITFLHSPAAHEMIENFGYELKIEKQINLFSFINELSNLFNVLYCLYCKIISTC